MKTLALVELKPLKTFRDKYLAVSMMVAAFLISSFSFAQTDSAKYSPINGYGFKYKRHVSDSVLLIPLSSSPHTPYRPGGIRYNRGDSTLQLWTGHQWNSIVTGGSGIDTAYALNDSTIAIETPNQNFFVVLKGQNISNTSLTATGDYIQDWASHWFYLNNLKSLSLSQNRPDPNLPLNNKLFNLYFDSTYNSTAFQLAWGLKDQSNSATDSLHFEIGSNTDFTTITHWVAKQQKYVELDLQPILFYPAISMYMGGNGKNGYYQFGSDVTIIQPQDSIQLLAKPSTTATKMLVLQNISGNVGTVGTMDIPAGGSASLSNQGSGYRLVKTADGQIKTLFGGFGIIPDSSTNTNAITFKADTSSANHLATHSALKDTAAAIRAAAGGGSTPGGSTTQIQFNNAGSFAGDAGLTYNLTTNKITTDSIRSIKNTPDTVYIGSFQGDKADTAYFFGTSITAGTAATSNASRYTKIVADGLRIAEANFGLGGYLLQKSPGWGLTNTFKDVYTSYIPVKLPGRKYIFLAWGENDATQDYAYHTLLGVDTSYFKRDYVIVIQYAVSQGWSLSDLRIISPFYQSTAACPLLIQQNYYDAAKHIADSMGIQFIDVFNQGKSYDDFIRVDYIHPSNFGHALAGNAILKQLTQPLQIQSGENFVNAGTTVLSGVKFFGKDTATAGYQLSGFNSDGTMTKVPSEVFVKVDNTNTPVQSGNVSVLGNITGGKAIRAQGLPTYTTGHGFEVYYDDGKGWLVPFDRDASTSGNVMLPFSRLIVGSSTPGSPFSHLYVNGISFGQGVMSSGNGNIGYNTNTNQTTLNMLVSGDTAGHITTFGPSGVGGYYRTAINGTGTAPVVIGTLADNGSGARLQVNGSATVSDDAYDATTWNGNNAVPTKNAIRDKIESLGGSGFATIDAQYTDANNTGTSATDLYSKTIAANQLSADGQSINFEAAGITNDATATVNLEVLFAGNGIAGTGAIALSSTGVWTVRGTIIRTGSTTARAYVVINIDGTTQKIFQSIGNYTGLDFTSTNILKIRATAGGAGGGSSDITAQMWKVTYQP